MGGGKKLKYKPFNKENLDSIAAKKKQEPESSTTQRKSKSRPSHVADRFSESQSKKVEVESTSASSTSQNANNVEVKSSNNIIEVDSQDNIVEQTILVDVQHAEKFVDKPNASQQVTSSNDDKTDAVVNETSEPVLTLVTEHCSEYLEEDSSESVVNDEPSAGNTLEGTTTVVEPLNTSSTNMDPTPKDVQVSKPQPDNPAWISGTCSPPSATHPFSSLNPNAPDFTPGSRSGNPDHIQPNMVYPIENPNSTPPFVVPIINQDITNPSPQHVPPGMILGAPNVPFVTPNVPLVTPNVPFVVTPNVQRPVPISQYPPQEVSSKLRAENVSTDTTSLPDHKNLPNPWHRDKKFTGGHYPMHREREEPLVHQRVDYNINTEVKSSGTTYAQQTKQNPVQNTPNTNLDENWDTEVQPNSENTSLEPTREADVVPKSSWGDNWSDDNYSEPTTSSNDRNTWNSNSHSRTQRGHFNKNNDRSRNYQGRRGGRGGEGRRWEDKENRAQNQRYRPSATQHEDWDQDTSETPKSPEVWQEETKDNRDRNDSYNKNRNLARSSFDSSRGSSDFNSVRGTGRRQNSNDSRGRNRGYSNRGHGNRDYDNKESQGRSRPFPRDENRDSLDKKNDDTRGHFIDDAKGPSTPQNQADEDKIFRDNRNKSDGSWRDRDNNSSNRFFSKSKDDGYRDGNRHRNNNSQRYGDSSGNFRGGRGRDNEKGRVNGRGRDSGRGRYNSNKSYNKDDVRQSPVEAKEPIIDDSSKNVSDNYQITSEVPSDVPEKSNVESVMESSEDTWGKSDVSQEANASWDADWNNCVDDTGGNSGWDDKEPEAVVEDSTNQSTVESIPEEKEVTDMPKRRWERDDSPAWSKHSSSRNNEREKHRRSYDGPKRNDPRIEREKLNKSMDGATDAGSTRGSDQRSRHTRWDYVGIDTVKEKTDQEFDLWEKTYIKMKDFKVVSEIQGNLFEQPKDASLAHCVAEDLRMGSGIAVDFKQEFKNVPDLLDQRAKQGGLATLHDSKNNRYVYYLVTKRESNGKPTYFSLWRSLNRMKDHIKENEIKKLAIPRLGCGLDRLEWSKVKPMIEHIFKDVDVEITVCNFQQDEEVQRKWQTCKLVSEEYPITEIASGTLILYFSTEHADVDESMHQLSNKFNFLQTFKSHKPKNLGEIVYSEDKSYGLCGCIVRKTTRDEINFKSLYKCVQQFNKLNKSFKKDPFEYVAFHWVNESDYPKDELVNQKIITILINFLKDVYVYVCRGKFATDEK